MKQYGRIIAVLKEYIFTKIYNERNKDESKLGGEIKENMWGESK